MNDMMTAKEAAEKVAESSKVKEKERVDMEWTIIKSLIEKAINNNNWYINLDYIIHEKNKKMLIDLGYSVIEMDTGQSFRGSLTKTTTKISWDNQ